MVQTRFERHSTFAQKYCKAKYKHTVVVVKDVEAVVEGKMRKITIAECQKCGWAIVTTHSRIRRQLKGHERHEQ